MAKEKASKVFEVRAIFKFSNELSKGDEKKMGEIESVINNKYGEVVDWAGGANWMQFIAEVRDTKAAEEAIRQKLVALGLTPEFQYEVTATFKE